MNQIVSTPPIQILLSFRSAFSPCCSLDKLMKPKGTMREKGSPMGIRQRGKFSQEKVFEDELITIKIGEWSKVPPNY